MLFCVLCSYHSFFTFRILYSGFSMTEAIRRLIFRIRKFTSSSPVALRVRRHRVRVQSVLTPATARKQNTLEKKWLINAAITIFSQISLKGGETFFHRDKESRNLRVRFLARERAFESQNSALVADTSYDVVEMFTVCEIYQTNRSSVSETVGETRWRISDQRLWGHEKSRYLFNCFLHQSNYVRCKYKYSIRRH